MIRSAAAVSVSNPVCADMLRAVGLGLLWSDETGPTERIDDDLLERVSPYQRVVIRTAQASHDGRLPTQAAEDGRFAAKRLDGAASWTLAAAATSGVCPRASEAGNP